MFIFCLTTELLPKRIYQKIEQTLSQKPEIGLIAHSDLGVRGDALESFEDVKAIKNPKEQRKALFKKQNGYRKLVEKILHAKVKQWQRYKMPKLESFDDIYNTIDKLIEEFKHLFPSEEGICFTTFIVKEHPKKSKSMRDGQARGRSITRIYFDFYDYELKLFSLFFDLLKLHLPTDEEERLRFKTDLAGKNTFSPIVCAFLEEDLTKDLAPQTKKIIKLIQKLRFYPDLLQVFCNGYKDRIQRYL